MATILEVWPLVHLGIGPEIGQVGRWHTRLSRLSTCVASDDVARCQPLHEEIECRADRHVLKALGGVLVVIACGIGHDLGKLASCDWIAGLEARVAR